MDKPVRVLHVSGGTMINRGVEKFLITYYQNIDRTKVQFDFLTARTCQSEEMRNVISVLGGKLFELNCHGPKGIIHIRFMKKLYTFLKENNYSVVSIGTGNIITLAFGSFIARLAGVPMRIVHSHNSGKESLKHWIVKAICTPFLRYAPTRYLACSETAGQYTFPKAVWEKITVIPNAIQSEAFRYNEEIRSKIRHQLGIENKFVIGHIGTFIPQKNHHFLIDIYAKVREACRDSVLLLIGTGELLSDIEQYVKNLGLSDSVIFYGNTDVAHKFYQAMDCFVFPSIFEGLPIVAIEAQAAGLKMLCSDVVTIETKITDLIEYMSLGESPEHWANKVLSYNSGYMRADMHDAIIRAGYDIKSCTRYLEEIYCGISKESSRNVI